MSEGDASPKEPRRINIEYVAERRGMRRSQFEATLREQFRAAYRHYAGAALQALLGHHHSEAREEMANSSQANARIVEGASEYGWAMAEAELKAIDLWEPEYPE